MPHNIFAIAMPDMNADYAVRLKVLAVDSINPGLNFRPRLNTPEDFSFRFLIAAPHQAGITHNRVSVTISLTLEQLIELIAFPENLLVRSIDAIERWLVPPCWKEWSWKRTRIDVVIANYSHSANVFNRFEEDWKGIGEWFIKITRSPPING
ncbi:hypothetical protein ACVI1J_002956 [Bradyrhizobium diazoefficiens]|jgi:hypothetical protein